MFLVKSNNNQYSVKVIFVGNLKVGKTSLIKRICENTFSENYFKTIGVDFKTKKVQVNERNIKYQIWDTQGCTADKCMNSSYFKGATCVVLVYAVDDQDSFHNVEKIVEQITTQSDQKSLKILVGNKCDLEEDNRKVQLQQAMALAEKFKMQYVQTSAKEDIRTYLLLEKINAHAQWHINKWTEEKEKKLNEQKDGDNQHKIQDF